jgi:hypothetical protein
MLVKHDASPIPPTTFGVNPPPAAYTYFGQFIDHNLTEDDTPMRAAGKVEPWETVNYRGPWLNLSGIYSPVHDRGAWRQLYRPDGLSFRLGEAINGKEFDLPLNDRGFPVLTDERNNENIIIRQIHVMFLKLHNLAIEELKGELLSPREKFAKAQERVCWQYQYLVRHDFLSRVCCKRVFEELVEKNGTTIDWSAGFSIPVEAAQAALRFGHSMVRPSYNLNVSHPDIALRDLLRGGEPGALESDMAVDWPTLLGPAEHSMRFDTAIASPLFGLESKDIHSYVDSPKPHMPHPLPVRTLVRGARTRLPTGQDVAKRMGVTELHPIATTVDGVYYDPAAHLRELGLDEATPLWYYLLLEAEVNEKGATLGELGSRLLIETINAALRHDPNSYLSQEPEWTPKPWNSSQPVKTLLDLARLVRLA